MVLEAQRQPLLAADVPDPQPGGGQVLIRVHACGVCRTDLHVVDGDLTEPKLPLVPGHQIVGTIAATGEGVERFEDRSARRSALAGLDLRRVPLLPLRPREPLRARPFHGLRPRRRLRRASGRRRALLLSPGRSIGATSRPRRCSARAHRLSLAAALRRCRAPRPLRLRRRGTHRLPGRGRTRAAACSPSRGQATPRRRSSPRTARRGVGSGARTGIPPSRSTPRSSSPRWARSCRPRSRALAPEGYGRLRRHPHERHPRLSLRDPLGRARGALGRQPHPPRRRGVPALAAEVPVRTEVTTYSAGGRQRGARRPALRSPGRRRGARPQAESGRSRGAWRCRRGKARGRRRPARDDRGSRARAAERSSGSCCRRGPSCHRPRATISSVHG